MVQIDYSKGFINEGNDERMLACMAKGLKGEPLTVAFLGGSITQGSLSPPPSSAMRILLTNGGRSSSPNPKSLM